MALGVPEAVVEWGDGREWRVPLSHADMARYADAGARYADEAAGDPLGAARRYVAAVAGESLAEAVEAEPGGAEAMPDVASAVARQLLSEWRRAREERAERYARRGHGHLV